MKKLIKSEVLEFARSNQACDDSIELLEQAETMHDEWQVCCLYAYWLVGSGYIDANEFVAQIPQGFSPKRCDLTGCTGLTSLPDGFSPKRCYLTGCTGLTSLPQGFNPEWCNLTGCTGLTSLPQGFNPEWCDPTGNFKKLS